MTRSDSFPKNTSENKEKGSNLEPPHITAILKNLYLKDEVLNIHIDEK